MRPLLRRDLNEEGFSEGARLFWLAIESRGETQTEAEAALGAAGSGRINRILYGERKPGLELAVRIRDLYGVPLEVWAQKPTEAFVPPGARTEVDVPIPYSVTRTGTDN